MTLKTGQNRSVTRSAIRPVLETLEGRQFFSSTGTAGGGVGSASSSGVLAAAALAQPSIRTMTPTVGETGVLRDAFVSAELTIPNGGVATATMSAATVKIYRTSDNASVAAVMN